MRVMRVAHHAVVSAWRERERMLRTRGVNVELFSARRWNEGGREVDLTVGTDTFVHGVATIGTHPNAFLYSPLPLARALGADPDLLDLHEEPFALATAEILALRWLHRRKIPYLLYSAQNIDKRYPIPFRWFETHALRHAAGAYVCNAAAGEILIRKGLRGPVRLIPLGVDVEQFHPRRREAPSGGLVVGYIGRLDPNKGVSTLLRAAALRPEWTVRLTGDGAERGALERLAAELGIADRVVFLGFAQGDELAERFRELDVLAVPSIPWPGWLEQFCRVAVEAMASGVPVVASRTGAIPDVVGEAGILVEPGDPDALAKGIDDALDPARWRTMRDGGLAHSANFSWDAVAAQHEELYQQVLSPKQDGAGQPPHVVVVAYGEPDMLAGALEDLEGQFPLTIVDNSSSAETRSLAESFGAHYIDPGANLGFGAGVNVGLRSLADRGLAASDVLLLNPDARIGPEGIISMHRMMHADPRLAAVGATQIDPADGEPVRVWWPFPHPVRAWIEAIGLGRLNQAHGFAIGSILMLRSEAIAEIGLIDERYFLYAEEVDWQKRACDRGWSIGVAEVLASHIGAGTSTDNRRREALFHASAETYQRKHFGAAGWQVYRAAMIAGSAVRAVVLTGERGRDARRRRDLYIHGPGAQLAKE